MSIVPQTRKNTAASILSRKGGEPIVALTSYHTHTAAMADAYVDILLVGDSLGMVLHGESTTLPVTLEMIELHGRSVVKGAHHALVVLDMPFGSYEESQEVAFRNAAHLLKTTGAAAVKLEGGVTMAPTIRFLTERGIPVMAHIGMTPQAILTLGSFRSRGRDAAERDTIFQDAEAIKSTGAFACVVEAVSEDLATEITKRLPMPTIGIGASNACDGQILVMEDMLGMNERAPKFVKTYAQLRQTMQDAFKAYASDVRSRQFPSEEHTYKPKA
jgi:3-methyl-2-oxobutanoate hydroxymethyltransferase